MNKRERDGDLQELRDTILKDLQYEVGTRNLTLLFEEPGGSRLSVHLSGVLQMSVSSTDDPALENVDVLHVSAQKVEGGGKQELERLGYMWRDQQGNTLTYSDSSLVHFLVEGDICIAVICACFEVRRAAQV